MEIGIVERTESTREIGTLCIFLFLSVQIIQRQNRYLDKRQNGLIRAIALFRPGVGGTLAMLIFHTWRAVSRFFLRAQG